MSDYFQEHDLGNQEIYEEEKMEQILITGNKEMKAFFLG